MDLNIDVDVDNEKYFVSVVVEGNIVVDNFVFGLFGNIEVVAGSELVVYAGFGKSLLRKVGIENFAFAFVDKLEVVD